MYFCFGCESDGREPSLNTFLESFCYLPIVCVGPDGGAWQLKASDHQGSGGSVRG